jgi:predicted Fe-Mo cluster-binding NifX family protein
MNIGITSNGQTLASKVSKTFEFCKYLLIVDTENLNIISSIKNDKEDRGNQLADEIIKHDCEAIITGDLNTPAFYTIADAQITRYSGLGYSVKEAIKLMEDYSLDYIKNPEGTDDCDGDHQHDENHCHEHDHSDEDCDGDCESCQIPCN